MIKRILVTGAAGFIGSSTVDAFLSRGNTVVGLDNFDDYYAASRKRANLERALRVHGTHFKLVHGDIRDEALVDQLCEYGQFDAIVHLAALAGVRPSAREARLYMDVNVRGSQNLLEAACRAKVPCFVFASSSSVYGASRAMQFVESDPCDRPLAPYAASKRAVELLAYAYHHLHGLNFTGLRLFSVYGPRCRPDLMLYKLLTSISNGTLIELYGGGELRRDFTYVDDIASGIIKAADTPLGYELINLGRGEPLLLLDVIHTLEELSGAGAQLKPMPKPLADVAYSAANIDKARALLDYQPRTCLRDGMAKLLAWYRAENAGANEPAPVPSQNATG